MSSINSKSLEKKPKPEVQKMLVYEPLKSDRKYEKLQFIPQDRRPRVIVCEPQIMGRSCHPKLCDCPSKSGNILAKSICFGAKVIAIITMVKIAYDTGVFSGHKKHSKMVKNIHKYAIKAIKEKAKETKERKEKEKKQEEKQEQPAVMEYEYQWTVANLWNSIVVRLVTGLVDWQTNKKN